MVSWQEEGGLAAEAGKGGLREWPFERGRNITKVSAASQFARSKRALVSGARPAKKVARALTSK